MCKSRFLALPLFFFLLFNHSEAQVTPSAETALGSSPYAVYNGGNIDSVNPISGNVFLHIPLLSYPQRGHSLRLAFNIYYNDKRWYINKFQQNPMTGVVQGAWSYYSVGSTPTPNVGVYVARDQHLEVGQDLIQDQYSGGTNYEPYVVTYNYNGFWIREPDGAQHYYADSASQYCSGYNCPVTSSSYGQTYPTSDGSGFISGTSQYLTPTSILGRDGLTYSVSSTTGSAKNYETITDKAGNSIVASASGWTDTEGRAIPGSYASPGTSDGIDPSNVAQYGIDPIPGVPVAVPAQCSGASAARQWTVPEPSGNAAPYYLCYSNVAFSTAFNIDATTGSTEYGEVTEASGTAPNLLTAIILPNGTAYRFAYDQYLSLASIELPTGGTITYTWQNLPSSAPPSGLGSIPVTRALSQRSVSTGSGQPASVSTYHRVYASNPPAGSPTMWTVITDPLGNDVEYQIGGTDQSGISVAGAAASMVSYYAGCSPHDSSSGKSCSGTGTLLQQVQYGLQQYYGITDGSGGGAWVASGLYRHASETLLTSTASGTIESKTLYTYAPNYGTCTTYSFNSTSTPVTDPHSNCFTTNQVANVARYDDGTVGSGAAGGLLNTTATSYVWQQASSPYLSANLLDLVSSVVTTDGSGNRAAETDYGYDGSGSPQGTYGNQTSTTNWLNVGPTSPVTTVTYNSQAMPTLITDPLGNKKQLTYQCSGSLLNTMVYPYNSSTTTSETTSYGYDCNSGYQTSVTDPNSVTTSYAYDALGRLTSKTVPNISSVTTSFNGDPSPPHVTTTTATGGSTPAIVVDSYYDGLGRISQTKSTSDPSAQGPSTIETTYDGLGRVHSVTNAHRSSAGPTDGATQYTYDALGRTIVTTQQDGSTVAQCYNGISFSSAQKCQTGHAGGTWIDGSDELGNTTQRVYDGLSRLKSVFEPGSLETDYAYDTLNNLTNVVQTGGATNSSLYRARTFVYDSLSRLLASSNPEKATAANPPQLTCPLAPTGPWTECFAYDANGNETKHTDNRNISTTLSYDALNRLLSKIYSDGTAGASFTYDTGYFSYVAETNPSEPAGSQTNLIGRLALETTTDTTGKGVTTRTGYSYDALGRVIVKTTCTPRTCTPNTYSGNINDQYDMHFSWDEASNMTYAGNGLLAKKDAASPNVGYYYSGLNLSYQGSPQVLNARSDLPVDATHPNQDIATGITYNPLGSIASASAGDELGQTFTYAPRGWLLTTNQNDLNGNQTIMDTSNRDLHGNLVQDTDSKLGLFAFCYDNLNRLYAAYGPYTGTAPACGSFMSSGTLYTYDGFGNLDGRQVYGGSNYQLSYVPNVHNQNPSSRYDAAGDLLSDGVHTYTYDAEGRITTVDGETQYFYDAEGNRVAEGTVGSTPTTDFLYDLSGHLITTVGSNFKTARTDLYAAGRHWGDYTAGTGSGSGGTQYRLANLVGTMYFNYDQGGNLLEECDAGVFGEALVCTPSIDFTETHFADEKRDQESNLDYMGARYYSSTLGRFMSPDPSGLAYADPTNPQTFNLYSYALNNPLTYVDPTGLYCDYSDPNDPHSGFDPSQFDYHSNAKECKGTGGKFVNDAYTRNGQDIDGRPQYAVSALSTPPAPGTDLAFDAQVAYDALVIARQGAQPAPTSEQYIQAIAAAAPTFCGGGVFGYRTREGDVGPVNVAGGAIAEVDSRSGFSVGGLGEIGASVGGYVGGVGAVTNIEGTTGLAYGGVGVHSPIVSASAGEIGFTNGVGVYAEAGVGGRVVGVGAYVNITSNAACLARQ